MTDTFLRSGCARSAEWTLACRLRFALSVWFIGSVGSQVSSTALSTLLYCTAVALSVCVLLFNIHGEFVSNNKSCCLQHPLTA